MSGRQTLCVRGGRSARRVCMASATATSSRPRRSGGRRPAGHQLSVERAGPAHRAGSDAEAAALVWWRLLKTSLRTRECACRSEPAAGFGRAHKIVMKEQNRRCSRHLAGTMRPWKRRRQPPRVPLGERESGGQALRLSFSSAWRSCSLAHLELPTDSMSGHCCVRPRGGSAPMGQSRASPRNAFAGVSMRPPSASSTAVGHGMRSLRRTAIRGRRLDHPSLSTTTRSTLPVLTTSRRAAQTGRSRSRR